MPMNPDGTFSRIWAFVDHFSAGDKVTRSAIDTSLDDLASGLNKALDAAGSTLPAPVSGRFLIGGANGWEVGPTFPAPRESCVIVGGANGWVIGPDISALLAVEENSTNVRLFTEAFINNPPDFRSQYAASVNGASSASGTDFSSIYQGSIG